MTGLVIVCQHADGQPHRFVGAHRCRVLRRTLLGWLRDRIELMSL